MGGATVDEISSIVSRLYARAMLEMGFRPEQAFAYVQDETSGLFSSTEVVWNTVLQTFIFSEGMKYGVRLSRESQYADDALDELANLYDSFGELDASALSLSSEELSNMTNLIQCVRAAYLL